MSKPSNDDRVVRRRPRVVYWNSQPTPYMVERWNEVVRRGNVELHAWFNVEREHDRSWDVNPDEWLFQGRYLPKRRVFGIAWHSPVEQLAALQPDLVIQEYASVSYLLGLCATRANARRVALRTLPTFSTWTRRTLPKELMKHVVFRTVDGVKTSGQEGMRMFGRYGIPRSRLQVVTQSIDVDLYRRAASMSSGARAARRAELGLEGCVFLYVGRLWREKGLDYLFTAFQAMRRAGVDATLLLAGDGVDEARYRAMAANDGSVRFMGFLQKRDLPELYAVADALVFPTLGDPHGLVVEEAMAAGLPVICTESAGEIRKRLPHGEAGLITPPADAAALQAAMTRLAEQPELRASMARVGAQLVAARSHEHYARDFERFVQGVLDAPARRTPAAKLLGVIGRVLSMSSGRSPMTPEPHGGAAGDGDLMRLIVCTLCRAPISWAARGECAACGAVYPIIDGIPIMLPASAEDAHKATQVDYYDDEIDPEFEVTRPHGAPAMYRRLLTEKFARGVDALGSLAGKTALTVCGGSGMDAEHLARLGAAVIASDISLGAARRTRERAERFGVRLLPIVADVERLPFADRSIDLVYVHDGLHHLTEPFAGLREMARVAGEAVSVTEPAHASLTRLAVRFGLAQEIEDAGNRVERLDPEVVARALSDQGFRTKTATRYAMYYKHHPGPIMRALSAPIAHQAGWLGWRGANALLGRFGNKMAVQSVRTS